MMRSTTEEALERGLGELISLLQELEQGIAIGDHLLVRQCLVEIRSLACLCLSLMDSS